jgi:hypothetical protein
MSLKQALYGYLQPILNIPINPDIARRKTRPYMIYQFVSAEHVRHTLAGSGFCNRRVQFDIYADSALEADTLFETLRNNLDNFRGDMEGLEIQGSALDTERDLYINPEDASAVGKHRRSADFIIWHRESIPDYSTTE